MAKPARNDGKYLEGLVQDALKEHHLYQKSQYLRMYDQTSTGGRGFSQPGDFLWFIPGQAVLIECKSTAVAKPLLSLIRSSKNSKDQVPRHRLHHIAGHLSVYIHGDLLNKTVSVYDGRKIVEAIDKKLKDVEAFLIRDLPDVGGLLPGILKYTQEI